MREQQTTKNFSNESGLRHNDKMGANCFAPLPLCRPDYQPINRGPNCLGSDVGNYLYTLMEQNFQKETPTPLI